MVFRAQSRLAGASKWSQVNRLRWLDEIYQELITEKKLYTDFRVQVVDFEYRPLFMLGGIFHNLEGRYVSQEEAASLDFGPPLQWRLNKPQKRAFSLLPSLLDAEQDIKPQHLLMYGSRRSGKTACGIMLALAYTILRPFTQGAVYVLSYKSKEDWLDGMEAYISPEWVVRHDLATQTIYFKNGSKITFYSEKNKTGTRGRSLDFVILDEASYYPNSASILTAARSSIVQYKGTIISVFSPSPVAETMYHEVQASKSPDPEMRAVNKSIFFGSMFDNQFLDEASLKMARIQAKSLSEGAYTREVLGKFSKVEGQCLFNYKESLHVLNDIPSYFVDITNDYICKRWTYTDKEQMEWIGGCDYNSKQGTSTTFTLSKLYWGPSGGEWVVHEAFAGEDGNTETFIYKTLLPVLRKYYPKLTDREIAKKVLIVGDSSGFWQSARMNNKTDTSKVPDVEYFKNVGFKVIPPMVGKKGMNKSKSNLENVGPNPARAKRREAALSRTLDRYGQPHLFFLKDGTRNLQLMAEQLVLSNGLPDSKSDWIHWWDALTYPIINLYASIQLFSTDPNELRKTYKIVYEIGQEKLTPAQRQAHPMVAASGKDWIT